MAKTYIKLTRPALRKLVAGEKVSEHGITFERQANGDGVFTVNVMVDGQRIHRVIGRESDGTTRTQAEEFIEKARQDAKTGRLNLPTGRKIALGFSDAADKYQVKLAQEGGKDLKMKRYRLEMHLKPFFGDTPLSKICTFDVERYKKQPCLSGCFPDLFGRARMSPNTRIKLVVGRSGNPSCDAKQRAESVERVE
ncbi:MAG: hypothetical protein Q7U78_07480, partial [Gallionella sp.]|nr:hypothetical protein [Gallionella sp.]